VVMMVDLEPVAVEGRTAGYGGFGNTRWSINYRGEKN